MPAREADSGIAYLCLEGVSFPDRPRGGSPFCLLAQRDSLRDQRVLLPGPGAP